MSKMDVVSESDSSLMETSDSKEVSNITRTPYLPCCEEIFALNVIYEKGSVATQKCSFVEVSKGRQNGSVYTDYLRNEHGWEGLLVATGDRGDASGNWNSTEYEDIAQAGIPLRVADLIEKRFEKTDRIMVDLLVVDSDSPKRAIRMIPWKHYGFAIVCVSHEDALEPRSRGATGHHCRKYMNEMGYTLICKDVLKQVMISETRQEVKVGTPGDKGRVAYFASADWFVNYSLLKSDQQARAASMMKSMKPAEVCATGVSTDDYIAAVMKRLSMTPDKADHSSKTKNNEKAIFNRKLLKQVKKSTKKKVQFQTT